MTAYNSPDMSETQKHPIRMPSHPAIAALTAADLEAVLLQPDRVGLPSSWWGHVPFAHWLVHELKPRLLVELGTQHGVSFSAFCNAVRRDGLTTRCYAIDTWQGDEHAGLYDESVFDSINAFVQQNYSSFATLIRSSFKLAIRLFDDGSIDLLHIDGLHTYEVVKADFDAWLPKLSHRGVVLIHDTAIHERGFEVWRFWREISQGHPSFEFHHSCGLGVLAPAGTVPDFISALVEMEPAVAATLRHRLAELGERWISIDERARASVTVEALRQTVAELQQTVTELQESAARHRSQLALMTQQADSLRLQLEQIRTSTSWRAMGPYRVAGRLVKRRVMAPLLVPLLRQQLMRDFRRISRTKAFNAGFYLGRESTPGDENVIMDYLAAGRRNPDVPRRRPMLGFHPLIYADQCEGYDKTAREDPLAHYLRTGMPDGPWKHAVIQGHRPSPPASIGLRILIHGHFHYPELLEEFLRRLRDNALRADLFITTTSDTKAANIRETLQAHDERATVVVVPNRGRDIGPMLMHFPEFEDYDIVGHLHSKRSPQQNRRPGRQLAQLSLGPSNRRRNAHDGRHRRGLCRR